MCSATITFGHLSERGCLIGVPPTLTNEGVSGADDGRSSEAYEGDSEDWEGRRIGSTDLNIYHQHAQL